MKQTPTPAKGIIAIHQPNFMPWLGFFQKLYFAETLILLDDAQYCKNSWINRTKIKGETGHERWLTVPVRYRFSEKPRIKGITIDNSRRWQQEHLEKLKNYYANAPCFEEVFPFIVELYTGKFSHLLDFNRHVLSGFLVRLDLYKNITFASSFNLKEKASQRLVELVRRQNGSVYLCGDGSTAYLEQKLFDKQGIEILFMQYQQPRYPRGKGSFASGLSIVDAAFHCGFTGTRDMITQYPFPAPQHIEDHDA